MELLQYPARLLRRRRHKRLSSTGIVPLSEIKTAAIWIDGDNMDVPDLCTEIKEYFRGKGIEAGIYALALAEDIFYIESSADAAIFHESDINIFGWAKRRKKTPAINPDVDLFISIYPNDEYIIEDAAICSRAKMKIGRIPSKIYDIVISGQIQTPCGEVFKIVTDILEKIK